MPYLALDQALRDDDDATVIALGEPYSSKIVPGSTAKNVQFMTNAHKIGGETDIWRTLVTPDGKFRRRDEVAIDNQTKKLLAINDGTTSECPPHFFCSF